ncbi:MAG: hydroxymethylbilane synthase [Planctomycetaceae bacterium]
MNPATPRPLRIASRQSALALWQANHVAALVRAQSPGAVVEIVEVVTTGDIDQAGALKSMGGVGVFTREVQKAVFDGRADLAVHSLKDLPTEPAPGLCLAAVPEREQTDDALILPPGAPSAAGLEALPSGARVGTGSLRRQAQLKHLRPDLQLLEIRGNVETRLRKLDLGHYDAIVLAVAGLTRLNLAARLSCRLAPPDMFPAVGQGALGVECRTDSATVRDLLAQIDHAPTRSLVTAERSLLAHLRAGCHAPVGAATRLETAGLVLEAVVLNPEGSERLTARGVASPADAEKLGAAVAADLLGRGAARLMNG